MTGNELLTAAIAKLQNAATGECTLLKCADGINIMIAAANQGGLDPVLCNEAQRLLFAAAPQVAAETAGRLAPEHVFHALSCVNAALTCLDLDRYVWLLASARVLESELRALNFRDLVEACNQPDLALAIAQNPSTLVRHVGPITTH
jgi:hypothetical protein